MYTIVRIIIMLTLFLIFFIMYGKTIKKPENKKKKNFAIIIFVIFGVFLSLPFENSIINFKKPIEAFKYRYFNKDIIKIIEDQNIAYIIYGKDGSSISFTAIEKKKNNWVLENSFLPNKINLKMYEKYTIITIQVPNYNKKMIIVLEGNLKEPKSNVKIKDNQNSVFSNFYSEYKNIQYYSLFYYTIIDSQIENYQLSINDKIVENVNKF